MHAFKLQFVTARSLRRRNERKCLLTLGCLHKGLFVLFAI